ncbi:response regulator transcription factor [Litorilituus lipolyticus]|uniref:Phosphate regulon transcriptional regulatory protein PhoB n=1 Tax=Litorilituus lipolyticus TaxID=2491017 RepID=A0A502KTH7_9GAMM|nr:response regulator transcription factor [Litorilituus lipolyticus]TPH14444.1 response regulator transcription factor [Litorilituus lipolyticus]
MNNITKDSVLIVEDEHDIAQLIKVHLQELALNVDICHDGETALNLALTNEYQAIILDVMLPKLSGLDVCRQVRDAKPLLPILMLTSRTSETDRVLGLELGADDYMTKPFSVRELQARVRAQLRRYHCIEKANQLSARDENTAVNSSYRSVVNGVINGTSLANHNTSDLNHQTINGLNSLNGDSTQQATCIGQLMIDHTYHQVKYKEDTIELTSTEFELLSYLGSHPDQVFSRSQLLDSVWGYHHSGYEHTVNSHINRLRNKLETDTSNPQIIQTVWGVGYKLNSAGVH